MNPSLLFFAIAGVGFMAIGVLLIVFSGRIIRRGRNCQMWSVFLRRNRKIATMTNILVIAIYFLVFGAVLLVAFFVNLRP